MKYLLLLILLWGCSRHYNPQLAQVAVPLTWKESLPRQGVFLEKNQFWELFEDPVLNALEEEVITANFDIQIAASRIEEARSWVAKQHAARLPMIDVLTSFNEDETLLNPPSFGSSTKKLERVNQQQYNLLTDLSYELDLWGKLKAKETSARHRLQAASWEYEFVYQTIVTDVAIHYFSLRTLEAELDFLKRTALIWKDTVELNESRVQAGVDPEIDLSRARLELALSEGEVEVIKEQYAIIEHALATLLGKPASSWTLVPGKLPKQIPELPQVLPSEILLRRADIQQQRALVSAGKSEVEVALRNYFPTFSLTTNLGLASPFISHFFEWQARYWSYAFNAIGSLFDGGSRSADVSLAKARFSQNFSSYQKSVNVAFQDVEDALSTLQFIKLQMGAQERALEAAYDTFSLAQEQFDSGLISYLLVADAEKTSIVTERKTLSLQGRQILAWIRLMKAFGINSN